MNRKVIIPIIIGVVLVIIFGSLTTMDFTNSDENTINITPVNLDFRTGGNVIDFPLSSKIFRTFAYEKDINLAASSETFTQTDYVHFELKPENVDLYKEIGNVNVVQNTVFVVPIFTISAYAEPGFYTYYKGDCDKSCLNVPIRYDEPPKYESSDQAIKILRLLEYPYITDIEIDKDPNILNFFDKVILLHNEYVTKKEFEAITNHPKVIYLHPNALYAEVEVDYETETISLVKGHNYPSSEITNGFNWEFDNTKDEYNNNCEDWQFVEIDNGFQLNCYPENQLIIDKELLKTIKDL